MRYIVNLSFIAEWIILISFQYFAIVVQFCIINIAFLKCHEILGTYGVGTNNAATQAASQTPNAALQAANAGTAAIWDPMVFLQKKNNKIW